MELPEEEDGQRIRFHFTMQRMKSQVVAAETSSRDRLRVGLEREGDGASPVVE